MSDIVDKLKSAPPPMMVPGCSTCRHLVDRNYTSVWKCGAQGGEFTDILSGPHGAWNKCKGVMWEPRLPILVRFKRWLIG